MMMWLRQQFLRYVLGIRTAQLGPHHTRVTIPEKHASIADRVIADTKVSAWRNGVEPIIETNEEPLVTITKIAYGGKTAEIMVIKTENKN